MDYDALRAALADGVPFNGFLGLEVAEIADGRAVVRLPDDERMRNHVGSQHAGGLFTAGEAASGGAFLGAFAERMADVTPLARSARIEYLKLANGAITATATLPGDKAELLATLDADGRVEFPIDVELTDESGAVVATLVVDWHLRRRG